MEEPRSNPPSPIRFTRIDSTNDEAKRAVLRGCEDRLTIVADCQTSGRGSHGRPWSSPPGEDLYLSVIRHTTRPVRELPPITLAAGLAVADTVADHLPDQVPGIKWPNDILLAGQKCAGILTETVSHSTGTTVSAIVGIGLNVNRTEWSQDLSTTATSMKMVAGVDLDREEVLSTLLVHVHRWLDRFLDEGPGPIVTALERRLCFLGDPVRIGSVDGTFLGVTSTGAARLQTRDGEKEIVSGPIVPRSHRH
ncbi:MAG: biotin--[acetyl-CoA-carboxylase] ligase [Myxococcales bacterium]|nr:biotin--[acetyl-CoA-carboxylase] ligase [Myxococcales bacterium]